MTRMIRGLRYLKRTFSIGLAYSEGAEYGEELTASH